VVAIAAIEEAAAVDDVVSAESEGLVGRPSASSDRVAAAAPIDQVDVVRRVHGARIEAGGVELISSVAAVDHVGAGPAMDPVTAVPACENVIAVAAEDVVVAGPAMNFVIAAVAGERIVSVASADDVVSGQPVDDVV